MGYLATTSPWGSVRKPSGRRSEARAGKRAAPRRSSLPAGPGPRKPWYAPDKRIRTPAAARQAARIATWAVTGRGLDSEPDEITLFMALHVCAYRATRCAPADPVAEIAREEWIRRWRDLRECIVRKNLGLVYTMLNRFRSCHSDEDDQLSEAMFGLACAAARFNPWKGYRFSTYACNAILRMLLRRSRRQSRYRGLFPVQHDVCIERPSRPPDHRSELYVERLNRTMKANLAGLTVLEMRIITERFPTECEVRLTLQKVADGVGLSKERVRQIEATALQKLRGVLTLDPILK